MTISQLLLAATCVYLAVLAAVAYFTRATRLRVLGALAGGGAVAVVGVVVEMLCQALGFWRYPHSTTSYGPPLMYPVLVIAFAIIALIGWRVIRRFGRRGLVWFLVVVAVIGPLRDYMTAAMYPWLIVFAPGIATVFVDVACWVGLVALALGVMRVVAGPAESDSLARRSKAAIPSE